MHIYSECCFFVNSSRLFDYEYSTISYTVKVALTMALKIVISHLSTCKHSSYVVLLIIMIILLLLL